MEEPLTATAVEQGAIQIANALWGSGEDPTGASCQVGGDLTTVRWVHGPTPAAYRLLQRIEHTCRN